MYLKYLVHVWPMVVAPFLSLLCLEYLTTAGGLVVLQEPFALTVGFLFCPY